MSLSDWNRIVGADNLEQCRSLIEHLLDNSICDSNLYPVTLRDISMTDKVTLICRRIVRENKDRIQHNLRQNKYRSKTESDASSDGIGDGEVTPEKLKKLRDAKEDNIKLLSNFDIFWKAYPRREAKKTALEAFKRAGLGNGMLSDVVNWIEDAKLSAQWQDKQYIPLPATFLNQRRWEGDPPPKKQSNLPDYSGIHFGDEEEEF